MTMARISRAATAPLNHTATAAPTISASRLDYLHRCPLCQSTDLEQYCRVRSRFTDGDFIRYDRCGGCGVVLRNPRLPPTDRLDRYAERIYTAEAKRLNAKSQ